MSARHYTPYKIVKPVIKLIHPTSSPSLQPYIHLQILTDHDTQLNYSTTPSILYELLKQQIIVPYSIKYTTHPKVSYKIRYRLKRLSHLRHIHITETTLLPPNLDVVQYKLVKILTNSRVVIHPVTKLHSSKFLIPKNYSKIKLTNLIKQVQRELFINTL